MNILTYFLIGYLIFALITQAIIGYYCYKAPIMENHLN